MADRTVEVKLRLITDQYKREAVDAAGKTEKLKDGIEDVDDELKKLPADSAKAAAALKLLGTEAIGTGNYIKGMGDKSHALQLLDARVREAENSVRRLGQEFVRTGSIDVWESLNRADSQLRSLSAMRKRLVDALEIGGREGGKAAVGTFAQVFQGGIVAAFQSLPSEAKVALIASLVGVAVAASPLIGATLAAGILAGVGGAGLAAGIALVAQDPVIGAAYSALGKQIGDRLRASAAPFREELVETSLIFGAAFDRQSTRFDRIFADLATSIRPLASGLSEMAENALPGIERAAHAAGPVLKAIADSLPMMGVALDKFFSSMAASGPGAAEAMRFILTVVSALIVEIGMVIEVLAKAYEGFSKIARFVGSIFYDNLDEPKTYAKKLDEVSAAADRTGGALRWVSGGLADMTSQVNLANAAFDRLFGTMMNIDTANLRVKEGMADLAKTAREGGATQDEVTGKVLRQIQALQDQREAQLASGDGSQAATDRINANYRAQLDQLKAMFPWLDGLIQKYEDLAAPLTKKINIVISEKRIGNVSAEGVISGGDQRRNVGKAYAMGGIRTAATGLLVPPSDPGSVLFGEPQTGGEALIPLRGITQARAMELSQVVGDSYGFSVAPHRWRASGGGPSNITINATFVDPVSGEVTRRQVITAAANRGQTVAQYLGVGER